MSTHPRVAVVGDNTIDRFIDEDGLELVGGNALNVAVQLAMMGVEASYFGVVGTDPEAAAVRDAARLRGVGLDGLVTMEGATALTRIRSSPAGDRHFESEDFGVTARYVPDDVALAQIAGADWVHIGMLPQADEFRKRLAARRPDLPISQDCSVSEGWSLLAVAFASAGEDPARAVEIVGQALAGGARLGVATLGSRGVYASDGVDDWQFPAPAVDVVDTTGAGDSFMAGFIAARLRGSDPAGALGAGIRRGSFTCRYRGGWPQIPADLVLMEAGLLGGSTGSRRPAW